MMMIMEKYKHYTTTSVNWICEHQTVDWNNISIFQTIIPSKYIYIYSYMYIQKSIYICTCMIFYTNVVCSFSYTLYKFNKNKKNKKYIYKTYREICERRGVLDCCCYWIEEAPEFVVQCFLPRIVYEKG